jgi:hypothetical protein
MICEVIRYSNCFALLPIFSTLSLFDISVSLKSLKQEQPVNCILFSVTDVERQLQGVFNITGSTYIKTYLFRRYSLQIENEFRGGYM